MTDPTKVSRGTVVERLVVVAGAALPGVEVRWGASRDHKDEAVMVASIEGDGTTVPTTKAGRLHRDDDFTIKLVVWAGKHGQTAVDAATRCEYFVEEIEFLLATDPTMNGAAGLLTALVSNVDGPDPHPSTEGFVAVALVDVECKTRLR